MSLSRIQIIAFILLAPMLCIGQDEHFISDIKQSIDAPTVDTQVAVFLKIGSFYEGSSDKVPPAVQEAIVSFIVGTATGKNSAFNQPPQLNYHGSRSDKAVVPLGISLRLLDYQTSGAADAIADLSKSSLISRSIRDRCIGVMRQNADDKRLLEVGNHLIDNPGVQDKQVAILAYAAMRKPTSEGKLHILNEIKEPALQVELNVLGLLSRADMSEEAVDLAISIMKTKPETASRLMLSVSDANPDMLSKYEADFSEISSRTEDARVKELVEKTLSKIRKGQAEL